MMARKGRYPPGYPTSVAPQCESEGPGNSECFDSGEDSEVRTRKWIDLNSASKDGFAVPLQVISLSKLSSFERKNLVVRLTSELQQIQLLQKRVVLQKKNTLVTKSSSVGGRSCNSAHRKGLQVNNGKESSMVNRVQGKECGTAGKFEPAKQKKGATSDAALLKQCESLLKKLMSQQYSWVFNTPVDVVKLNIPDYFDVIKNPMDLGTIKKKLTSGKYTSPLEYLADVRLTFSNAKTYNPPGTDVHLIADSMSKLFESRWKAIEKKLSVDAPGLKPENSVIHEETEIMKPYVSPKKRKLSPVVHEPKQKSKVQKMTDEEKHKLGTDLEGVLGDLPERIINFLKAQTSNGGNGGEDEIEIDIDDLTDDALLALRKLLDDHLQDKQKSSEACEIELPNVSGLSNSSLQVDKGSDSVEGDVDIGGNEAPVTSYPPVLICKDATERPEECMEAGPDSDAGSECSKGSLAMKQVQNDMDPVATSNKTQGTDQLVEGHAMVCEHSQPEQGSQIKLPLKDSDDQQDVREGVQNERQLSPDKLYRAAILKERFADTILKAQAKASSQDDKVDPEKLLREKEELEMKIKREKARLQAEARAAEDARRQSEAEAAAEAKRKRDLEREAAREALHKMEKTVEMNENSQFLEDLEMLRAGADQLPSSADEISPDNSHDVFGSFKFGGGNPLEQLGLYMKVEEDEEEVEPLNVPKNTDDEEEGEID